MEKRLFCEGKYRTEFLFNEVLKAQGVLEAIINEDAIEDCAIACALELVRDQLEKIGDMVDEIEKEMNKNTES